MVDPDGLKRRIRKLKRLEVKLRFPDGASRALVWDEMFDLRDAPADKAKYTLQALAAMSREEYRRVTDEFFARVYFELYRENGITGAAAYDPELLARLDLPCGAGEGDVKRRFRELAKRLHPDTGGDAGEFIELMRVYERLTGRN